MRDRFLLYLVVGVAACGRPAEAARPCKTQETRIVVETSRHQLALCEKGRAVAVFNIRLGRGGVGKKAEGDKKTPVGLYPVGEPRVSKKFGVFIPIGYPTPEQRRQGYTGGEVGVHGPHRWVRWLGKLVNTFDSSDGCVGVATDSEIHRIADWVWKLHPRTIEIQ